MKMGKVRTNQMNRRLALVIASLTTILLLSVPFPAQSALPSLPRAFVNTAMPSGFNASMGTVNGSTFTVNAGGNIQAAINSAAAADGNLTHQVVINAGSTFTTNLVFPAKSGPNPSGSGWIIVRTSNLAGISAEGKRILPAVHAAAMPKIQIPSDNFGAVTNPGAHHYRFIGLEVIRTGGAANGSVFQIWGSAQATLASIPTNIVLDRVILRTTVDTNKVLSIQGGAGNAVIDSHIENNTTTSGDSFGLWFFNGPGPVKAVNNYVHATGSAVFFGAACYVSGYTAQDIEFRRNRIRTPLTSMNGKNVLEFKQGLRVWIAGNIFEDGNVTGQPYNMVLTPQDEGSCGLPNVDDIIIEYNLLRRLRSAFTFSGQGFGQTGQHMRRVALRHNFLDDVGLTYGGNGHQASYNNGTDQVTVDHNTIRNAAGNGVRFEGGGSNTNWVHTNNIIRNDVVSAAGGGTGTNALNTHTTGRVFSKNVLVGAVATYTGSDLTNNFFLGSIALNADGSLPAGSPFENQATDGTNIGADFTALYGIASGVGRFGTGVNDFYAYDGQWPASSATPPDAPINLRVI